MTFETDTLGPLRVAYVHTTGPLHEIPDAFSQLMEWAALAGIDVLDEMTMVVVRDDEPGTHLGASVSYDAAITVGADVEGTAVIGIEELPEATYAVRPHTGSFDTLADELGGCGDDCRAAGMDVAAGPALIFVDQVMGERPTEEVTGRVYVPIDAAAGGA